MNSSTNQYNILINKENNTMSSRCINNIQNATNSYGAFLLLLSVNDFNLSGEVLNSQITLMQNYILLFIFFVYMH